MSWYKKVGIGASGGLCLALIKLVEEGCERRVKNVPPWRLPSAEGRPKTDPRSLSGTTVPGKAGGCTRWRSTHEFGGGTSSRG